MNINGDNHGWNWNQVEWRLNAYYYSIVYIIAKIWSIRHASLHGHLFLSDVYRETKKSRVSRSINLQEQTEIFISLSHFIENLNKLPMD